MACQMPFKMFVALLARRLKRRQGETTKAEWNFLLLKAAFEFLLIFNYTEPLISKNYVVKCEVTSI